MPQECGPAQAGPLWCQYPDTGYPTSSCLGYQTLLPHHLAFGLQRRAGKRKHRTKVVVPELPAMVVASADGQGGGDVGAQLDAVVVTVANSTDG